MQGSAIWSPPTGTLGRIISEAAERVSELRGRGAALERSAAAAPQGPSFREALSRQTVGVIAEIKRKSPSKGWIKEGLSAVDQARAYADGGAAAISVLTEPKHFDGSIGDLDAVVGELDIPVLKKDFHIDPIQLLEARAHGATAALLIVRALDRKALVTMVEAAIQLKIETLVEVRDETELQRAIDAGARIIGVNTRDLETLVIDPTTVERLLSRIPAAIIAVAESGISTVDHVRHVGSLGADAVLVGSILSSSDDPESLVRRLASVARTPRA